MDFAAARKAGQPIWTAIAYLSCKLSNTELPAIVHKALDDSKLLAGTEAAADEAVAMLLAHYSCSSIRHHLDRAFYGNCVHRIVVHLQRCLYDVQKRGIGEVGRQWRLRDELLLPVDLVGDVIRAHVHCRKNEGPQLLLCLPPALTYLLNGTLTDFLVRMRRHRKQLRLWVCPVDVTLYAGWRAELCPAVAAAGLGATERWKANCWDLQCTGCDFWFKTTRVCGGAPGTALGGTSSLKWPRPPCFAVQLPEPQHKLIGVELADEPLDRFPLNEFEETATPPDLPVLTAAPSHPRTRTVSPYPEATLITLVTWSMALPDTGVKWVTYLLPGSATTATCSSAVLSPPRPVLVWSCRPSKYKALISSALCCWSRVAIALCLIRHHSLQTFFGSTNSFVLPLNTRPMSTWKPLMTAATAWLDKPYLSAASAVFVKSSLFDSWMSSSIADSLPSDLLLSLVSIRAEESPSLAGSVSMERDVATLEQR